MRSFSHIHTLMRHNSLLQLFFLSFFFFFFSTENVLIWKLSPCLDIFDPVSDVEELKAAEVEKEKLRRHLKLLESFLEHHGEKGASERDGGIKSNYLNVEFLTLFMSLSFEISRDWCVVAFYKNRIKYWKSLLTDL